MRMSFLKIMHFIERLKLCVLTKSPTFKNEKITINKQFLRATFCDLLKKTLIVCKKSVGQYVFLVWGKGLN